jgi:hypothetical protein
VSTVLALNNVVLTRSQLLLRAIVIIAMTLPAIASVMVTSPIPVEVRLEAALLCAFCLLPAWSYLGKIPAQRPPIPFLPIIGVLYALYFALSAAIGSYNQHYRIVLSPRVDYDDAVFTALVGWLALLTGLVLGRFLFPKNMSPSRTPVAESRLRFFGATLMMTGLAFDAVRRLVPIPVEIAGILVFASSLGWFGSGMLVTLNVRKRLTVPLRLLMYLGVTGFFVLAIAGGSVAAAAFYGTIIVVAAWIGRGRLSIAWIIGIVIGATTIVSLRGVAEQFRRVVWFQDQGGSTFERTTLFFGFLQQRIATDGVQDAVAQGFETSAGRSANLDLLADVIRRTPSEIPYWGGETYLSLAGAFIPRFLWPDKPIKELGQAFGHRYGYIGVNDTNTAVNLPFLVEFYLNFGMLGVVFGMTMIGVIYRLLARAVNNPGQDDLLSLAGIVLMIPLTNIESDFSLGFGGLILNFTALWLILRLIKRSKLPSAGSAFTGYSATTTLAAQQRPT